MVLTNSVKENKSKPLLNGIKIVNLTTSRLRPCMVKQFLDSFCHVLQRFYPPSVVELDGIGTCELTANEGHNFCPNGAMDCIDSPFGPKCRSELESALVEASSKLGKFSPSN